MQSGMAISRYRPAVRRLLAASVRAGPRAWAAAVPAGCSASRRYPPSPACAGPALAADNGAAPPRSVVVPGFWDPRRRPERPDLSRLQTIRFLTETDYPPFDYAGPDGNPAGFNVDLARLICEEIKASCTIQTRRFDTLLDALNDNRGDAVIASIAATRGNAPARRFHRSLLPHAGALRGARRQPASATCCRNCSRARRSPWSPAPRTRPISRTLFTEAELRPYPNAEAAREALRNEEVDLLFGDGIALAFWLNGTDSGGCCAFRGGPFLESRYFGEGVGIAVKRGNDLLRQAFNWALFRQWEKGTLHRPVAALFPDQPVLTRRNLTPYRVLHTVRARRNCRCRRASDRKPRTTCASSPSSRTPGRSRRRARSSRG